MQEIDSKLDQLREATHELVIGPELMAGWLEDLPDAFLAVTEDGMICFFNSAAEMLFGYPRVEVLGRPLEILVPENLRQPHVKHRETFLEDPHKRAMGAALDLTARHKSGKSIPVQINLSPKMTSGGLYTSAVIRRKTP